MWDGPSFIHYELPFVPPKTLLVALNNIVFSLFSLLNKQPNLKLLAWGLKVTQASQCTSYKTKSKEKYLGVKA